jgi:hypothetical protein
MLKITHDNLNYSTYKHKENTPAPDGAYLCTKPKLIDFYKALGERKLPP